MNRKQQLLGRHRRRKRLALALAVAVLLLAGWGLAWWLIPLLALLAWIAHEAWFADHLFYSPREGYRYRFSDDGSVVPVRLEQGRLVLAGDIRLETADTLILGLEVSSTWLGRFLDPWIGLQSATGRDCQTFERGARGRRYLNLSGFAEAMMRGELHVQPARCRVSGDAELRVFRQPGLHQGRLMVIAPHADDAELAAFGLYSQAKEAWIVTLTAGEIETGHYRRMGLDGEEAARLKGRLRAWDSIAVARWGGVPEAHCVQLGYFCLQLPAMRAEPDTPVASREAGLADTRPFRVFNPIALASDTDGAPTWRNLLGDLRELIERTRPEVMVLPHPTLDPHPDHVCAHAAVREALQGCAWQPRALLGYANHLHDNDRWPMGEAGQGVALPPLFEDAEPWHPHCLLLSREQQVDKAMALGMMHDLQVPLPFKRRLRRVLQQVLAGRRWPAYGEDEFFRKAVRRHELYWLLPGTVPSVPTPATTRERTHE